MKYPAKKINWLRSAIWVSTTNFAEGIPYVTVMTLSLVMYKRLGLSNEAITFYTSWLYLPWVIKPLWAPFIDNIKTKRFWILSMELLIGAAMGGVAFTIPSPFWLQSTLFLFWLMAFGSATHDIAVDGFYMLGLNEKQQSMFVGLRSLFYRVSMIVGQGLLVMLAGNLETITRDISYSWALVFYLIAGLFLALFLLHSVILPKPLEDRKKSVTQAKNILLRIENTFFSFFKKPQVIAGICFMLFYRMPEGLLVKVSTLFLIDRNSAGGLGLSPAELGLVQGTVGVIGLLAGGIYGGILAGMHGLKRCLWPMVLAISLPNAVYIYLSCALPDNFFIINICVFVEQFGYGFGFTAYMLYLIYYSRGEHKTSHYALCTAFMALSMMIPGLFAGALQEAVGYKTFFVIVMASCVITFIVAAMLKIDPSFGQRQDETEEEEEDITV